jgi:hypothetical protein
MFAYPPRDYGRLVVYGMTTGGRAIDPLTGRGPARDEDFGRPTGMSQKMCTYQARLANVRGGPYRSELRRYLERWRAAANPEEKLASYMVEWVSHRSPPPGSTTIGPVQRTPIFEK